MNRRRRKPGRPARNPVPPAHVSQKEVAKAVATGVAAAPAKPSVTTDAAFWRPLLSVLETRPTGMQRVKGASGLEHDIVDVGLDEARKRVVIITDSPDPKAAAFIQSDVQQLHKDAKVIVARTVLTNVGPELKKAITDKGVTSLDLGALKNLKGEAAEKAGLALITQFTNIILGDTRLKTHNSTAFIQQLISQFASLNWSGFTADPNWERISVGPNTFDTPEPVDRLLGICPLPIHAFTADEVENVKSATSLQHARELLERHDCWGYFFPKSDELALGLIDRGVNTEEKLATAMGLAPANGHPIDGKDTIPEVTDVLSKLSANGFVGEAEITTITTTPAGKERRTVLKVKPKETLVTKLLNLAGPQAVPFLKFFMDLSGR